MRSSQLTGVFLIALVLRGVLWVRMFPYPQAYLRPDSPSYTELAANFNKYRVFSRSAQEPRFPETFRTPGYPLFLSVHFIFSEDPRWPALTQILLDSGTAVIVALCSGFLTAHPLGWAAGLLYALDPMAAAHSPLILSETLFTFLLALSLYALLRAGSLARGKESLLSGFCLGLATLTRPVSFYLWIFLVPALWLLWGRRKLKSLLLYAAAAALIPGLWCARNYTHFGHFNLSSLPGINLFYYEAPAVKSGLDKVSFAQAFKQLDADFSAEHPILPLSPFEESRMRWNYARGVLEQYPITVFRLHLVTGFKMLFGPGLELLAEELTPAMPLQKADSPAHALTGQGTLALLRQRPWLWIILAYTMILLGLAYLLAACGACVLLEQPQSRFAAAACLIPLGYLLIVSAGGWSYYRFRVPLWPFVAVLAAGVLNLGCAKGRNAAPSGARR